MSVEKNFPEGGHRRKKVLKVKTFVEECLASGIASPSEIRDAYKARYGIEKSADAFRKAINRQGITSAQRKELGTKKLEIKELTEYSQVQNYVRMAELGRVQRRMIDLTLSSLRELWNWMNNANPENWTLESILDCVKQHIPMTTDDRGRVVFEKPGAVLTKLGAFNRCFPNILPKGWTSGFYRPAGELKDYLTFQEFDDFINALTDTEHMALEGWRALFKAQVNMGCREGHEGRTGILSLRWEDINFEAKRCSLREKGGKGKAGRMWKNLPLEMFPWLHGWADLMQWWILQGKPTTGRVFPVTYNNYSDQFHASRKACNGRIAGDLETMRPHVLRKTHAQWCVKLWIPVEQICGIFPDGYFGVGWDNPTILLKYYITLEDEQRFKAETQAIERMEKLGLVLAVAQQA